MFGCSLWLIIIFTMIQKKNSYAISLWNAERIYAVLFYHWIRFLTSYLHFIFIENTKEFIIFKHSHVKKITFYVRHPNTQVFWKLLRRVFSADSIFIQFTEVILSQNIKNNSSFGINYILLMFHWAANEKRLSEFSLFVNPFIKWYLLR